MSKVAHDPICSMARTILAILSPEDSVRSRGLSRSTKELIKLALSILLEDNPQTLRHLHYAIFSLASINYKNDIASYRRLSRALTAARRRYRDWELYGSTELPPEFSISPLWIVDEERRPEITNVWKDAAEYVDTVRESYRRDLWQDQPHYCELWGEKKAVLASLRPIASKFGITLRACKGFGSAGMEDQVGRLFEGIEKPITVFYIGDHDASGVLIERDMRRRVQIAAGNVPFEMVRLAVLDQDISAFNLAPQRIKDTDSRAAAFRRQFGADAATVELEALPAAELKRRVNSAIEGLIDRETWRRQAHVQDVELASIADFAARMKNLPQIGGRA